MAASALAALVFFGCSGPSVTIEDAGPADSSRDAAWSDPDAARPDVGPPDGGPEGSVLALAIPHLSRLRSFEVIEITFAGEVLRRATVPGTTAGRFWWSEYNQARLLGTDTDGVAYVTLETESVEGDPSSMDSRLFRLDPGSEEMVEMPIPADIASIPARGALRGSDSSRGGRLRDYGHGEIWVDDTPSDANEQREIAVWNVTTGERRDIHGPLEIDTDALSWRPYWFGPGAALRFIGQATPTDLRFCVWTLDETRTGWECLGSGGSAAIDEGPRFGLMVSDTVSAHSFTGGPSLWGEPARARLLPCDYYDMAPAGRDGLIVGWCTQGFGVANRDLVALAGVRFTGAEREVTYGEVLSVFPAQALDW